MYFNKAGFSVHMLTRGIEVKDSQLITVLPAARAPAGVSMATVPSPFIVVKLSLQLGVVQNVDMGISAMAAPSIVLNGPA